MKSMCRAVFLSFGMALLAALPGAAQPDAQVPWERIDEGLARLAAGDGKGAAAAFVKAKSADGTGLAELLLVLNDAYVVYTVGPRDWDRTLQVHQRLDIASQTYHQHPVPPAVLAEALTRIRALLKEKPGDSSSPLLRPLLCHLRLLSQDDATDGEAVLEITGKSRDVGSLQFQRPLFQPLPPIPEAAREAKIKDSVMVELTLDSEGCPASETMLKPLPQGLAEQTLATLKWWAYEPARYNGTPVGFKFNVAVKFVIF
ncbi:MAG TPA: energy transducer TonB [Thermoanaerobaculia bacterium]|jgi:hypothetical protein